MKEIKLYQCSFCGTQYNTKEKCKECEKGHVTPKEIVDTRYLSINENEKGYPLTISVKMSDGIVVIYKR